MGAVTPSADASHYGAALTLLERLKLAAMGP